jgi:threonylcarbamoyladenosine tRNA methylthiotransferase MtaB
MPHMYWRGCNCISGWTTFLETYHFLNEMNIYLHVFTYSERDNTEAAAMEGVVPANVRANVKMLRVVC